MDVGVGILLLLVLSPCGFCAEFLLLLCYVHNDVGVGFLLVLYMAPNFRNLDE